MEADARLVEDVGDADQGRADLRGQADALGLAAGEGHRRAVEGEVAEADLDHKAQALAGLPEDRLGDLVVLGAELEALEEGQQQLDRPGRDLADVVPADLDHAGLLAQPLALAGGAHDLAHQRLDLLEQAALVVLLLGDLVLGLTQAPLEPGDHALEGGRLLAEARDGLVAAALQEHDLDLVGELDPRGEEVELVVLREGLQGLAVGPAAAPGPHVQRALLEREVLVGDDPARVEDPPRAEAVTRRAGAVGAVEGEQARRDLRVGEAVVEVGALLAEQQLRALERQDLDEAAGQAQRDLEGVGDAAADPVLEHEAVDVDLDRVALAGVERDRVAEVLDLFVDRDPAEALAPQVRQQLLMIAGLAAHDRGQHAEATARRQREHAREHVLDGVPAHRLAGLVAVDLADAGVEEAQEVVDLRRCADGRARVAAAGALLDGDRGAQALDQVGVGLRELGQELPRRGAHAFDVAPLALREDRVEGEAALARTRRAGDHDQLAARQVEVDALEVVGPRAADADA